MTPPDASIAETSAPPPSPEAGVVEAAPPPAPRTVVLFGGVDSSNEGDTWLFDGVDWTQQPASGPPARTSGAATSFGGGVLLFGGYTSDAVGDTWVWSGATWTPTSDGPPGRVWSALTPQAGNAILFGGWSSTAQSGLADTWVFTAAGWTQLYPQVAPGSRWGHAMATLP